MGKCTEGLQGPCMRLRQELPAITACDHLENPATGASIPQGLSHVLDAPTIPEGVACSPLSGTKTISVIWKHSPHAVSHTAPRALPISPGYVDNNPTPTTVSNLL
jgi:hypothetical protein